MIAFGILVVLGIIGTIILYPKLNPPPTCTDGKNHGKIGEVIGYIVNVIGEKGIPELMDDEIEEGFVVKWVSPDEAKRLFHQELERESAHVHIPKRALAFLEAAFPEQG
jgi:hypothetical protein